MFDFTPVIEVTDTSTDNSSNLNKIQGGHGRTSEKLKNSKNIHPPPPEYSDKFSFARELL